MFPKKKLYLIVLVVLLGMTYYMFVNREFFIQEHLTNNNPTLVSLQQDVDDTNVKIDTLQKQFTDANAKMQAQGAQAAAAQAALGSIPAGYNDVIPTK